jgi:hypothetical protein
MMASQQLGATNQITQVGRDSIMASTLATSQYDVSFEGCVTCREEGQSSAASSCCICGGTTAAFPACLA